MEARPFPNEIPMNRIENGNFQIKREFRLTKDTTNGTYYIKGKKDDKNTSIDSIYLEQRMPMIRMERFRLFGNSLVSAKMVENRLILKFHDKDSSIIDILDGKTFFKSDNNQWMTNFRADNDTFRIRISTTGLEKIKNEDTLRLPFGVSVVIRENPELARFDFIQLPRYDFRVNDGWTEQGDTIIPHSVFYGSIEYAHNRGENPLRPSIYAITEGIAPRYPRELILDTFNDEFNKYYKYPHYFYLEIDGIYHAHPTGDIFQKGGQRIIVSKDFLNFGNIQLRDGSNYFQGITLERSLWYNDKKDSSTWAEINYQYDNKEKIFKSDQKMIKLYKIAHKYNKRIELEEGLQYHESKYVGFGMRIIDGGRGVRIYSIQKDSVANIAFLREEFDPKKIPVSVENLERDAKNPEISIYPNPANQKLKIRRERYDKVQIYVFDILGQSVIQMQAQYGQANIPIDISGFETGNYTIMLRYENGDVNRAMFIKE